MHKDYVFPRAFLGGVSTPPFLREDPSGCMELSPEEGMCGEVVYEEVLAKAFDLAAGVLIRDLCVLTPQGLVLVARRGTKAALQEITGLRIAMLVSEGDEVEAGEPLARVLTGKGEIRTARSSFYGKILYIGCLPESQPERCVVAVVSQGVEEREVCRRD